MSREFSSRVFLNRSERNEAQAKLKQTGLKSLPDLFRFAVKKLEANLAGELLELKAEYDSLFLELSHARNDNRIENEVFEQHKLDVEKWRVEIFGQLNLSRDEKTEAEKALRLAIAECERLKAEVTRLTEESERQCKRADTFEQQFVDMEKMYDTSAATVATLHLEIDKISENLGCKGAKLDSLAPRAAELKRLRDKYLPAYQFLTHGLGLNKTGDYEKTYYDHVVDKLFVPIVEDKMYKEYDAHLRFGLRISNVVSRYANAKRTETEYFNLLCQYAGLDKTEMQSLQTFAQAFDKKNENASVDVASLQNEYEDVRTLFREMYAHVYYTPVVQLVWDRIKRFFTRERVQTPDMVMYARVGKRDVKEDGNDT